MKSGGKGMSSRLGARSWSGRKGAGRKMVPKRCLPDRRRLLRGSSKCSLTCCHPLPVTEGGPVRSGGVLCGALCGGMDGHGWGSLGRGPQRWASGSGDVHQTGLDEGPALRFFQDGKGPGRGSSAGCGQRGGGVGQMNGGDSWPRQKDAGRGVATVLRVISIDHQFPHLLQMSPSADEERKSRQGSAPNPDGSGHHWRLAPDLWRATPLPVSSLSGNKKLAVETAPVLRVRRWKTVRSRPPVE